MVCSFERKVLVKAAGETPVGASAAARVAARPTALDGRRGQRQNARRVRSSAAASERRWGGFAGFFQDFAPGDVICHEGGRTVGEAEHMQLTCMFRNTHPLHFDELYARLGLREDARRLRRARLRVGRRTRKP